MCLEFLHVSCRWEFIAFNWSWRFFSIICPTEKNSVCWWERKLRAIIMSKFPRILITIKLNLLKDSFSCSTNHSKGIYRVIVANSDRRVSNSFDPCLLWTWWIENSLTAILHSYSIGNNHSIDSTSCNNIILTAPS